MSTAVPRRERLKQELRQQILDAARSLFVGEGYASVSMRKIAETVGCSPGTLYLYFEDKDTILNAICLETFSKLDARMAAIASDTGEPMDRLRRGGRMYIQFALDHPHHYWLTFGMAGATSFKHDHVMEAGLRSFDCLRQCVRACVDAGLTNTTDLEELTQAIWSQSHGVIMLLIAKPQFPFVEHTRLVERVLDITIEGIRKREPAKAAG